jgi:hypothetical protein
VGLERGPLGLVSTIEQLLGRKIYITPSSFLFILQNRVVKYFQTHDNIDPSHCSVVVKTLCCKPEGHGFETRRTERILLSEFLAADLEAWFRFQALPDFVIGRGSGTGSTQPREYN